MLPETRTDVLKQRLFDELERHRVWLDRVTDLRSIVIDIKLVRETGLPRAVIIRTETEN